MSDETLGPARRFAHEFELPTVCARKALVRVVESAAEFAVARKRDVDLLTFAERRDLANALRRATWSAVLAKTRVRLAWPTRRCASRSAARPGPASQMLTRVGTRPVIVAGGVIAAAGVYWLSRIPIGGSYGRSTRVRFGSAMLLAFVPAPGARSELEIQRVAIRESALWQASVGRRP